MSAATELFSSDSSDDAQTNPRSVRINVRATKPPSVVGASAVGTPAGYELVAAAKIPQITHNTLVQYENAKGKLIRPKYFKKIDPINGTILVGFFTHDKRNYSEKLSNIKALYKAVVGMVEGGVPDDLRGTIEISSKEWKDMRRDMIVSYKKRDGEIVSEAKFNAFTQAADGSSRMSLTSKSGYNYTANPTNITNIYRHVTSNDKTLTLILQALRKLEMRIQQLEKK